MERQSFWCRTMAPELAGLESSGLGLRGFAMAQGQGTLLLFLQSKVFSICCWIVRAEGFIYGETHQLVLCLG